jgi:hypothetical protein
VQNPCSRNQLRWIIVSFAKTLADFGINNIAAVVSTIVLL